MVHVAGVDSTDNGIGIMPEQAWTFVQMFCLYSCSAYEGTGFRLAICRKIVEHHGGRLWVESAGGMSVRVSPLKFPI